VNDLSGLLREFRDLSYVQKRIKLDEFAKRIDARFANTYYLSRNKEYMCRMGGGEDFIAAGTLMDGTPVRILLALLGNRYEDDPDHKINFFAAGTLIEMVEFHLLPVSVLLTALQPDASHPDDDWRRYWIVMSLARIETDDATNALIDILENDADRGIASVAAGAFRDSGRVVIIGKDRVLEAAKKRINSNIRDHCSRICQKILEDQEENPAR